MKYNFENKTAIITGSTGGIGLAIVDKFVNNGATVVAFGTNQEKLDNLAQKYESGKVITVVCDLSKTENIAEIIKKISKIDFLVCNAGVTKDNLAIRMKDEEWDEVLNINLKATFCLNREVLKIMLKQRFGSIVNIASIIGITGNAGQVNYAASKSGMIGMTKSLAQESASRGIRLNVVAPGFIATPMTDVLADNIKQKILDKIPLNSFGDPKDIANAVAFLSSDEASYITGATINVNGGMGMF